MNKESIEPICKFEGLKELLKSKGYVLNKVETYTVVKPTDIDFSNINNNNIEYSDDGIFVLGNNGTKQRVFLYKRDYHLSRYGNPRFHIKKCAAVKTTGSEKYRIANTEIVTVQDMDDGYRKKEIEGLPICKYCLGTNSNNFDNKITNVDFVQNLKKDAERETINQSNQEVDILGYTRNWEKISSAFRIKNEFKCNKCGLQITNPFDYKYIHVHHKDGNKTNNMESNLECLCIRCHAGVDEYHKINFSKGGSKKSLEQFNKEYPNK